MLHTVRALKGSGGDLGLGRWSQSSVTGTCAHWVRGGGAAQGLLGRREEEAGGLRDR